MNTATSSRTSSRRNMLVKLAVAGFAVIALSACSRNMNDLHRFVQQAKAAHKIPPPPPPQIKPHETFKYADSKLRDPFSVILFNRPSAADKAAASHGPRPDKNRPKEVLESYPLDSLHMVGTLAQGGTMWALIQTPDGTIHRVTVDNYMGENDGKITKITQNRIDLTEIVPDGLADGNYVERPASIALSK